MNNLYDRDIYAWAKQNARLLRDGRLTDIDIENVAEELESLARHEQRLLRKRQIILLQSLLQWQCQPGHRSGAWRCQIEVQRMDVEDILRYSPSLRGELKTVLTDAYGSARRMALSETGLVESTFPSICPYMIEDVMDHNFWPD